MFPVSRRDPQKTRTDVIALDDDAQWYKDAILYEIHIRAFMDSNGDGIGDFPGLIEKLDYLQDLGVTALWLLPFYPSPLRNNGYDIADYNTVNPIYGNLDDFQRFLEEPHRRGMRIITELVVNHTSDQHPWFQRTRRRPAGSPERDFYVWSEIPKTSRMPASSSRISSRPIGLGIPSPRRITGIASIRTNPTSIMTIRSCMKPFSAALDFWLDMGVDGVRLDAIPYLYEREGTNCENLPETHDFLKKLRRHVDAKYRNRILLAEANQWPEDAVAYFGDAATNATCASISRSCRASSWPSDGGSASDHRHPPTDAGHSGNQPMGDVSAQPRRIDVGNGDGRRPRLYVSRLRSRPAGAHQPRHPSSLAPLLQNNRRKIELMNGLLFSLPGTPVHLLRR